MKVFKIYKLFLYILVTPLFSLLITLSLYHALQKKNIETLFERWENGEENKILGK